MSSGNRIISTGVLLVAVWLAGCDSENASSSGDGGAGSVGGPDTASSVALPVPPQFEGQRAIVRDALRVEITVNGRTTNGQRNGDTWSSSFSVGPGEAIALSLVWFETFQGVNDFAVARLDETFGPIDSDTTLQFDSNRYVTSGDGLDYDNDGVSNFDERVANSNPFDPNDPVVTGSGVPPGTTAGGTTAASVDTPDDDAVASPGVAQDVLVTIPAIDPARAPGIDGQFDEVWRDAQYNDTTGAQLSIDNLLVGGDKDPLRSDQQTEFRWGAMHDGRNLYVLVRGESMDVATPTGDTRSPPGRLHNDDSVDLFFDGDNSRFTRYDSVDDTHFLIALLDDDGNATGRVQNGFNTVIDLPAGLRYFNCLCSPVHTWEISIPLASLNIVPGRPFGMEVQINDDLDGGTRDAKWAWFNPSGSDRSFADPSVMGQAVLE